MRFLVTAWDYTDAGGLDRRMAERSAHLRVLEERRARGEILYALAMCDESGKLIGSTVVFECPDRAELDGWLASEPYVTGRVWERIEVRPCRVAPMFAPRGG